MKDMVGRSPGKTCQNSCWALKPVRGTAESVQIPFNKTGGACGAAMRAMCIGLRYPKPEHLDNLVMLGIESGRMTHHHPTGFLGALAAALFVSYSIQEKPLKSWGAGLMSTLPKALEYIKKENRFVKENVDAWPYFTEKWTEYLK